AGCSPTASSTFITAAMALFIYARWDERSGARMIAPHQKLCQQILVGVLMGHIGGQPRVARIVKDRLDLQERRVDAAAKAALIVGEHGSRGVRGGGVKTNVKVKKVKRTKRLNKAIQAAVA